MSRIHSIAILLLPLLLLVGKALVLVGLWNLFADTYLVPHISLVHGILAVTIIDVLVFSIRESKHAP